MRPQKGVFHELLKLLLWAEFERLVEQHGADLRFRGLPIRTRLIALP